MMCWPAARGTSFLQCGLQEWLLSERWGRVSLHIGEHPLQQDPQSLLEGSTGQDVHGGTECHPDVGSPHASLSLCTSLCCWFVLAVTGCCCWDFNLKNQSSTSSTSTDRPLNHIKTHRPPQLADIDNMEDRIHWNLDTHWLTLIVWYVLSYCFNTHTPGLSVKQYRCRVDFSSSLVYINQSQHATDRNKLMVCLGITDTWSTLKVHPLELPRGVSGPVQFQWRQGCGVFPSAGQRHRFPGHPAAGTLHMCRVGHGECNCTHFEFS